MGLDLVREVRGAMTHFNQLTPELIAAYAEDDLTYDQLTATMAKYGLDIKKVVLDETRAFQNVFYADYENGWYGELYLRSKLDDYLRHLAARMKKQGEKNANLLNKEWENFYYLSVPLPMAIYDFQKRHRDIDTDEVFDVWLGIHTRLDYANGMWDRAVLEYVFSFAPKPELPPSDEDGLITIYRGTGALSQSADVALSWSTEPCFALWFANRSARGTHLLTAKVHPDDVVAYFPENRKEHEIIVRPGATLEYLENDMIPSTEEYVPALLIPATGDFFRFGKIALRLGYPGRIAFSYHCIDHILRVLLLSLVYFYNAKDQLSDEDKHILIYFSLLHDIGREGDDVNDTHGENSLCVIQQKNIRIKGLALSKKGYRIANLIIVNHCRSDEAGIAAIQSEQSFTRRDKERAVKLYSIAKDMDALDRVRFNGLDYRLLRTPYARRLPLVAGGLLKENLEDVIRQMDDGSLEELLNGNG